MLTSPELDATFPRRAQFKPNSARAYPQTFARRYVEGRRLSVFAPVVTGDTNPPLEGENIETTHWEDARHWMSIYADLLDFKRGLLDRIDRDMARLPPVARAAAGHDVRIIESQMEGYQRRLELWYRRVWDLHGLWLDQKGRTLHYQTETAALTEREFQLLQFLLEHPHRYFSVTQILSEAWANPGLFPEEVRTYVRRLRKLLTALHVPCDIVNRPQRGYCLKFREDE